MTASFTNEIERMCAEGQYGCGGSYSAHEGSTDTHIHIQTRVFLQIITKKNADFFVVNFFCSNFAPLKSRHAAAASVTNEVITI